MSLDSLDCLQLTLIGKLAEHIRELINRSRHKSHNRLKRWVLSRTGMASCGDKLLRPGKLRRQRFSLLGLGLEGLLKSW